MSAWLETNAGEKIHLVGSSSLGRDRGNTIVLPGNQVSRRHAMIHIQGKGEYWIVDLGSSNGVVLNGRRLKQPVALKDLDRLEIGPNALIFRHSEVMPEASAHGGHTTSVVTLKGSRTVNLWLLIADIEKFTPLSQTMPGDELAKLVGKWIYSCKEVIEKNYGEINKYLGDGFLAFWPSPETKPEHIASTLAELKQIQAAGSLPFRLVVHYGSVTIDNALSEGEDALIGPDVNFVFRMEKVAGGLNQRCVVSKTAGELLKQFSPITPQGEHTLSGFNGTHPMFSY